MDYYKILGVGKNCTIEELKKAFRTKSKQYHPDLNKDDPNAVDSFIKIKEAYEYLSMNLKNDSFKKNQKEKTYKKRTEKKEEKPLYKELKYSKTLKLSQYQMDKGNYNFTFYDPKEDKAYLLHLKNSVKDGEIAEIILWEHFTSIPSINSIPIKRIFYIRIEKKKSAINDIFQENLPLIFCLSLIIPLFGWFFYSGVNKEKVAINYNHQVSAIITEKMINENYEYLIYKNLNNNNYYKVNNALRFWNNKVGDTVVVTFKQKNTEKPTYLSIKKTTPIKK